ncbi:MAG: cytochrome c oxidase subunit 3 [Alphaproteobacteria bacterium]|nr:cytochrome c oxidase subunit 3 [Alphaproteobacteria bacterium]
MADHGEVKHDYHLVNPSSWPVVGSIGALVFAFGLIHWMQAAKGNHFLPVPEGVPPYAVFLIGALIIAWTMIGWWGDVIKEAEVEKVHTPVVVIGLRYGMALFIASEVMFFVAWFWAYFNAALFPHDRGLAGWPPEGIVAFDPWHLPIVNTLILLTSGTTVTWAHHALQHGNRAAVKAGLWLTILLGISFTCVQAIEYSTAGFGFAHNIYGATFFMATGFHGFHVIVGTIFLIVILIQVYRGHFSPERHFGFEAAAWYWHFVDVVWLFLFAAIYLGSAGGATGHH